MTWAATGSSSSSETAFAIHFSSIFVNSLSLALGSCRTCTSSFWIRRMKTKTTLHFVDLFMESFQTKNSTSFRTELSLSKISPAMNNIRN